MEIDPPDNATKYDFVHIFNENKNPIDINGNIVDRRSKDAHIQFGDWEDTWKK